MTWITLWPHKAPPLSGYHRGTLGSIKFCILSLRFLLNYFENDDLGHFVMSETCPPFEDHRQTLGAINRLWSFLAFLFNFNCEKDDLLFACLPACLHHVGSTACFLSMRYVSIKAASCSSLKFALNPGSQLSGQQLQCLLHLRIVLQITQTQRISSSSSSSSS